MVLLGAGGTNLEVQGAAVERGGSGKKPAKVQDPAISFEPWDPAMPETRPLWTFASISLLVVYCYITNHLKMQWLKTVIHHPHGSVG